MAEFQIYNENHQFYLDIQQHKRVTFSQLEKRINSFDKLDELYKQHELDLYHLILKHARACHLEEPSACAAQRNFTHLQRLILSILSSITLPPSYSLLICLLDLVKNSPLSLSNETLHLFLSTTYPLWQHEKICMCRKSMELCKRIIPLLEKDDDRLLLPCTIKYIYNCKENVTRGDIERITSHEYTEFSYTPATNAMVFDRECIKLLIQIILNVFLYNSIHHEDYPIQALIIEIEGICTGDPLEVKTLLFDLCCANDDDTIQLLDTILSIYQQPHSNITSFLKSIHITPHTLFLFFLERCGNTHDIIIDLLLENDSEFLSFFHRYIMYTLGDIECFFQEAAVQDKGEIFTRILANTILVLEGNGFPYNTKPLIKRLGQLEDLIYNYADEI